MSCLPSWLRQSIKCAMTAIAILGILFAYHARRISHRQQFIARLEAIGAEVTGGNVADPTNGAARTSLSWLVRSADSVAGATGLGQPQRVVLSIRAEGDRFADGQFKYISEAAEVRHLYLKGSKITDVGVAGMTNLQELRTIDLSCTPISDLALERLSLCESLRKVTANETGISRQAIEQFRLDRPEVTVQWSEQATPLRRKAIGALLTCGGELMYDSNRAIQNGRRPDTVVVRGRWSRNIDHAEQTECLLRALDVPDLTSLWLQTLSLTESEIEVLRQFAELQTLRLERVRSDNFQWLESLTSLEAIHIGNRMRSEEVLSHVCRLPKLRSITAENVTDSGAEHIGEVVNLETIWLSSSKVSDQSIRRWAHLDQIQRLIVDSRNITNASLPTIGSFLHLTRLQLNDGVINNEGLLHLQQLKKLRFLSLNQTNVTPAGLLKLVPLKQLRLLRFATREDSDSDYVDLLDHVMNSFWDELSYTSEDELRRMLLDYSVVMSKTQTYSLGGAPIDMATPEAWIDELIRLLAPVKEFCVANPECDLR